MVLAREFGSGKNGGIGNNTLIWAMSPTQRGVVLDHVVLDYMELDPMALDPMVLDPMVLVRDACDRIVLERVVLDGLSCVIAGAVLPRTFADLFWPCNVGR